MTAERAAQGGTPRLSLSGLAKRFGKTIAVYPLDLEVAAGEILAVLGPRGSGKTTLLRMIAGLEAPTQGDVRLDGQDMTWAAPGKRDIAYVFQDPALYPHLSVLGNAAFPLEAQGLPAAEAERLAADRLRRLGLEAMANLRPKSLSPGDLQRAALARALVRRPRAFLLDEPLGRVDGGLRDSARETLRALLAESGAAALVATHDQEEAMALADRVAVIKDGRILQVDAPRALYENPGNLFVADFVGSPGMNLVPAMRRGEEVRLSGLGLAARVQDGDGAGRFGGPPRTEQAGHGSPPMQKGAAAPQCWLGVRPENVLLSDSGAPCRVERVETLGSHGLLTARLENGAGAVRAWLPAGVRFREGQTVGLTFLPSACRWFDGGSGESLPWKTLEVACLPTP